MLRRSVDVWGEGPGESSLTAVGPSGIRDAVPLQLTSEAAKQLLNGLTPIADVALHQWGRVPTLRALVLGFIGRHIDSPALKVVPYLAPLPADIKACLLCVARRRGVLSNRVLLTLAEEGWTLMDLAGATSLTERAIRQALRRCPQLRALDLSGLSAPSAAFFRDLPDFCPSLELLAVGGCKTQEAVLLEVLPDLLPHIRVRQERQDVVQESWEDAVTANGASLPDSGERCGLQRLKLLVWPNPPPLVAHIVRTVNPRVAIAESLPTYSLHGSPSGSCCSTSDANLLQWPSLSSPLRSHSATTATPSRSYSDVRTSTSVHASGCSSIRSVQTGSGWHMGTESGIQVIRVRTPEGQGVSPSTSAATSSWASLAGRKDSDSIVRYVAPHLRQQQQHPQVQVQAPAARAVGIGGPEEAAQQAGGAVAEVGTQAPEIAVVSPPLPALSGGQLSQRPAGVLPSETSSANLQEGQGGCPGDGDKQQQHQQRTQLDDCLAVLVGSEAWEGMHGSRDAAQEADDLHIAEKFRRAYMEQDARLRAKASREAAAALRYELRISGAARAMARWLDEE